MHLWPLWQPEQWMTSSVVVKVWESSYTSTRTTVPTLGEGKFITSKGKPA